MSKYILTLEQKEFLAQYKWLTNQERIVFERFYQEGIHIEDIAAEIDRNRRTVDRILQKLRDVAEMSRNCR